MKYLQIVIPALIVIAWVIIARSRRNARRKKLLAKGLSDEHIAMISSNMPLYNRLPEALQKQLQGLVNVFIDEKNFEGCGGLELTDEMRYTIAAQACLLLLNRKVRYYPKLRTIYVYRHTYVAKENGFESVRLGESWQNGPVVLAWDSVKGGARNIHDGRNVVIHEFSHQLDQEDGSSDGAPILDSHGAYSAWARVCSDEFEKLRSKGQRETVLSNYGATNPAEFFAVVTEAFFEKPKQMSRKHPELYEELKSYYKVDPLQWV